jgi:cell division protein ZapE
MSSGTHSKAGFELIFMDVVEQYEHALQRHGWQLCPSQWEAVKALEQVRRIAEKTAQASSLPRVFWRGKKRLVSNGCYLWGDVGRGKTWLMDLFYTALSTERKQRWHFHQLMQWVHDELRVTTARRDPLKSVAQRLANARDVICIDEFQVFDITDAMLLHGLFQALFELGVQVVFTSNHPPDELYKNGLQRERFVPAIELIKQHTQVLHLAGERDFRREAPLNGATCYFLTDITEETEFIRHFRRYAGVTPREGARITVNRRDIAARFEAPGHAWFEFQSLCGDRRAAADYNTIAERYRVVFVNNIPTLTEDLDDCAKRFMHLIDTFYDRRVIVMLRAQADIDAVYAGKRFRREFRRTASRLSEMRVLGHKR